MHSDQTFENSKSITYSATKSKILMLICVHNQSGEIELKQINKLASIRMHMRPAYETAKDLGLHPRILAINGKNNDLIDNLGQPKACIINKVSHFDKFIFAGFATQILASTARLKANGCKIILSYSDNHGARNNNVGLLHRNLITLADHIVVPSATMARIVQKLASPKKEITIIEDHWQTKLQNYSIPASGKSLNVSWFGNGPNIEYLVKILPSLLENSDQWSSYQLKILTTPTGLKIINEIFLKLQHRSVRPWTISLNEWDDSQQPSQLENFLGSSHVVLLPSDPLNSIKAGISHNRMVDAARSGCFVIASGMGSYLELRKLGLIGENHAELFNNLIQHIPRLSKKYSLEREKILEEFSPKLNKKKWEKLLTMITTSL